MRSISIGGLAAGGGAPPLVIAEIGINHNGDLEHAKRMIESARSAGAALVKLQSFQPENFMKSDLPYHDNIRRLSFSFEQHEELFAFARKTGAILFSAAFDAATADFLDQMGAPAFKIASMDCNNFPLLRHVAKKGKPIILATGMAGMEEVDAAVRAVRSEGNTQLVLLHCVSDYPTNLKQMNLNVMQTLAERFDTPVGLSDHSEGLHASFAAAAMGAAVIERHFTMDRKMAKIFPFSDHAISIEPHELEELARYCRGIRAMQGDGQKALSNNEAKNRDNFRRGLFAGRALRAGETITPEMLIALRPVRGLSVAEWDKVIGKKLARDVNDRDPLTTADLA